MAGLASLDLNAAVKKRVHISQEYFGANEWGENEKNMRLFLGASLPYQVTYKKKAGGTFTKTEMRPAIITKGLIDDGSKFELIGSLPPDARWTVAQVKKYQEDGWTAPAKQDVLETLDKNYHGYCDLGGKSVDYLFVSLWTIGTYMFSLFSSYPYLSVRGAKRSGKTKFLSLLEAQCFNGRLELDPSKSVTFRIIDGMRPTFIIDEFDYIDEDAKGVILSLLRAGYKKSGGTVARTKKISTKQKGEDFGVDHFHLYCPKAFAAVWEVFDVSDRCITISLVPTLDKTVGCKGVDPDEENWGEVRDMLYRFALENAPDIKNYYDVLINELELDGRSWELWKPILAIAKFIGEAEYLQIIEMVKAQEKQRKEEEQSHREEGAMIRALKGVLGEKDVKEVMIAEIAEFVKEDSPEIYDFDDMKKIRRVHTRIGRVLTRLQVEGRRIGKGKKYIITKTHVEDLIKRFNVEFVVDESLVAPDSPPEIKGANKLILD
jgi:hypothetical protein